MTKNIEKLYNLALKLKQAWEKYKETEHDFGYGSLAEQDAWKDYENAEHKLLGFIFDKLD